MRCHAETPCSVFFPSVLSFFLSSLPVAGCLLLHLPHSLRVQKPGYKIWTFLLQPGVRIASPRICPICCVPFPPFVARSKTWIQNLISSPPAWSQDCLLSHLPHSFRVQKPGYKIWTLLHTCLSSFAPSSGPLFSFPPLRTIRYLRLSPILHSCSLTSFVLISDL